MQSEEDTRLHHNAAMPLVCPAHLIHGVWSSMIDICSEGGCSVAKNVSDSKME